jgi:formylglycine-generating enzyme required for sulfatase activity
MPRPLHLLLLSIVAAALVACGRAPPPPVHAPATAAGSAASARPARPAQVDSPLALAPDWRSRVPVIAANQAAATLRRADAALDRGQLDQGNGPGPGALELYLAVTVVAPDDVRAARGVEASLDALIEQGRLSLRAGRFAEAQRVVRIAESLLPNHPDLAGYRRHVEAARHAADWIAKGSAAAAKGRYTQPAGASALDFFVKAERAYPDFAPARAERARWNRRLLQLAERAAAADDYPLADRRLRESERLSPRSDDAKVAQLRIIERRTARTRQLRTAADLAVDRLRLDRADDLLSVLRRVAAQPWMARELESRIYVARHYGPFEPGQAFSESLRGGGKAPEMVVVRFGGFMMGSDEGDPAATPAERPFHAVAFARGFSIARNEVTVGDFRRFVEATRYVSQATRAGRSTVYDEKGGVFSEHPGVDWRRDHMGRVASPTLPVVHVAWADAVAYTRWLSTQTGQRYRLPSEAEFEYVLRAGRQSLYPWGALAPRAVVGNLTGDGDLSRTGRRWSNAIPGYRDAFWGPAPVRSFPLEPFATYDMIGNVAEWTLDCWHDSYQRAPDDGSAWVNPGCPRRVARGASWSSALDAARSAARQAMHEDSTSARLGFRVVREL